MNEPVSIIERVSISDDMRLVSVQELREFCDELENRKSWQILAGRREGDHAYQIEIFVTIPKKVECGPYSGD